MRGGILMRAAVLLVALASAPRAGAAGTGVEGPEEAARAWLAVVDQGPCEESWESAAMLLDRAVGQPEWRARVSAVRASLGPVVSRALSSGHSAESLPGAPDGSYVVHELTTVLRNGKESFETVVPVRGQDGAWRVSDYFVR